MTRFSPTRSERIRLVVLAVVFVLLTVDVFFEGPTVALDHAVRAWVAPTGPPSYWARSLSSLGDPGIAGAVVLVFALLVGHFTWRIWPFLVAGAAAVGVTVVVIPVKALVGRVGPGDATLPADYPGVFPSGHTATAAVGFGVAALIVARQLCRRTSRVPERVSMAVGLTAGAVTGAGVIGGDYHWFTDVVGALIVAAGVLTAAAVLSRGLTASSREPSGDTRARS